MLFVPLPLIVTILLLLELTRFVAAREMTVRAHQLFAGLIGLFALQALLVCLRWGYDLDWVASLVPWFAPVLPVLAYMAYLALAGRIGVRSFWPLGVLGVNWLVYVVAFDFLDFIILATYIGFGSLLLLSSLRQPQQFVLSPLGQVPTMVLSMGLVGAALIASGLTDLYLIYDFIRNDGQNIGFLVTLMQSGFMLAIGVCSAFSRSVDDAAMVSAPTGVSTASDQQIVEQLRSLLEREQIYRDEDLSVRKLSRKLGIPDRQISGAVNRVENINISRFINEMRISDACELLVSTDQSVLGISLTVGFGTKSNFNREFLRVTGLSPSNWRQVNRSG